jgi:tetratricopeptide (TPR) repeat protein
MRCPDAQKLLEYEEKRLSGRKRQKLKEHICSCSECQEKLSFLRLMDISLSDEPTLQVPEESQNCIDEETMSAYLDHTLTKQERTDMEKHLAQCGKCLVELASLYRLVRSIETEGVQKTPDWLLERAGVSLSKERWWQRVFRPFFESRFRWASLLATVCILVGILVYANRKPQPPIVIIVHIAALVQESLEEIPSTRASVAALKTSMDSVNEDIIMAIAPSEDEYRLRHSQLGLYSAALTLCLRDEADESLREYRESILERLGNLMQEMNLPDQLAQKVVGLRDGLSTALYSLEDARQAASQIGESLEKEMQDRGIRNQRSFWFGKFTFALNVRTMLIQEIAQQTDLENLLDPRLIEVFEEDIRLLETKSRQRILSQLPLLARRGDIRAEELEQLLRIIGGIHHHAGHYHQALTYYQEALEINRETGDETVEQEIMDNIQAIHRTNGGL